MILFDFVLENKEQAVSTSNSNVPFVFFDLCDKSGLVMISMKFYRSVKNRLLNLEYSKTHQLHQPSLNKFKREIGNIFNSKNE